jgi:hypothetical protein
VSERLVIPNYLSVYAMWIRQMEAVQVRWLLNPAVGLPLEPFKVWTYPPGKKPMLTPISIAGFRNQMSFSDPMAWIEIDMTLATGAVATATAYTGGSLSGMPIDGQTLSTTGTLTLFGDQIGSIMIVGSFTVTAMRGITASALANDPAWTLVETVGLPIDPTAWAQTGYDTSLQGLVSAPQSPLAAAARRLAAGPKFGWAPTTDRGTSVPAWQAPDPTAYLNDVTKQIVSRLHDLFMQGKSQNQQSGYTQTTSIPGPSQQGANPDPNAPASSVELSPLQLALMAASTDPFASLALGFGTSYPLSTVTGLLMVTVNCKWSLWGIPTQLLLADFVPARRPTWPPLMPQQFGAGQQHLTRPKVVDGSYSESVRLHWTRDLITFAKVPQAVSFAVARFAPAPNSSGLMLQPRTSGGGWVPFAGTRPDDTPSAEQTTFIDGDLVHPPGASSQTVTYAVAAQNLFGFWSGWTSTDFPISADPIQKPTILSQKLTPAPNASGPVQPGTLVIEFAWDWSDRRPESIQLVGVTVDPAARPLPSGPTAGMQMSIGGPAGSPVVVQFSGGDTPSVNVAGGLVQCLDATRTTVLTTCGPQSPGGAQATDVRNYRLTIPGFTLDFTGRNGVDVTFWARADEHVRPSLFGDWTDPCVALAPSPVPPPPPFTVEHPIWSSLPDAAGVARAHLTWTDPSNSPGYYLYSASESAILDALGLPPAQLTDGYVARLATLRALGGHNLSTVRSAFRRVQESAITGTSYEVSLPRGSRVMHCYVVTATSANNLESPFPTANTAFMAVATPRLAEPAEPTLRVVAGLQGAQPIVTATVTLRTGAPVSRLDLYRTTNERLAVNVDHMNVPYASSSHPTGWTFTRDGNGVLTSATYVDTRPIQGWQKNWYRVVAWSDDDVVNGEVGTRSPPSPAKWAVVPPVNPPLLFGLRTEAASNAQSLLVSFVTSAQVGTTPLGTHTMTVTASPLSRSAAVRLTTTTDAPPLVDNPSQVPAANAAGGPFYRVITTGDPMPYRYYVWVQKPPVPFWLTVRITDPLGRSTDASEEVTS